jgi:iron complex outermembrane receptor protein
MIVKRGYLKVLGLAVAFCAISCQLLLAQNVTISGKVLDETDNSPFEGVTVQVIETSKGALTDSEGQFSISTPSKPSLTLKVSITDFKDAQVVVKTEAGKTNYEIVIKMQPERSFELDPTVITDSRHEKNLSKVTTSMAVVKPAAIDLQATNDVEDVLNQTPGVDVIDGQPNIRGSSGYAYGVGSRVMVMLDGLPLLSGDASAAQFDLIPTDNIQQIEIMKGASSVLYGSSALGGVINVITADVPDSGKTSVRLRGTLYGPPSNRALDWDGPNKNPMTGAVNVFHARKIGRHDVTGLVDFWKETGWKNSNESEQARFMLLTKFRPASIPGLTFGVNGSIKYDSSSTFLFWDSYLPDDSVYAPFSTTPVNSLGGYSGANSRRDQLNMRYTLDPFVKYATDKGVHAYRGHIQRQVFRNNTNQSNRSTVFYNDYQYNTSSLDGRMNWVTGATFIYNAAFADSLYSGGHYSINPAVYTQLDGSIKSWLSATVGGRFDYIRIDNEFTVTAPVFRAGLNFEPMKGSNIRVSWGQAFRSPSVSERFTSTFANGLYIRPNPTAEPERGYSAEIAARQGFMFGSRKKSIVGFVDVAAFMMDYNNMIEFGVNPPDTFVFPPVIEFSARNVAKARIKGIEASTLIELTYNKWSLDLSGGITYIIPKNLLPTPDTAQSDIYGQLGNQDNPTPPGSTAFLELLGLTLQEGVAGYRRDNPEFLKYRSTWTNRATATLRYGRFSLTANYRYKSQVLAIDQFLYVAIAGSADFMRAHPKGFTLVDGIFAVDVGKGLNASFNVDNVFNKEWAELPGIMGAPRNYTLQLKYVF